MPFLLGNLLFSTKGRLQIVKPGCQFNIVLQVNLRLYL
jgi:hypothetical protein